VSNSLQIETPAQLAKKCNELNKLESLLAEMPAVEHPETHRFTPGLYSRQILLKAGILCTSKIHKTEHQYIVSRGKCKVWTEGRGWELIVAPYHGTTKPGARRALFIIEDVIWTTFHPTSKTDMSELESDLIEPHDFTPQKTLEELHKEIEQ